jgi:phospholipid/cholesterol/gamma-HCH transport system substrate-binding protein
MTTSKAVGAGAFVVIGMLLFTVALFMIGERRLLFTKRYSIYTEFARLGQLQNGAVVRVSGMDAGEVTEVRIPQLPSEKFRVRLEVRQDMRQLVRADSLATTQTEGLVGAIYVNINAGTDASPIVPPGGTIAGRDPFQISDLLEQASSSVKLITETVESLRGDAETAVKQIALTAEDAHGLVEDIRPDITDIARNGSRISADTSAILAKIKEGQGTVGKLINDDGLYEQAKQLAAEAQMIATEARAVMGNVRELSAQAKDAIADFRSPNGPTNGLMTDMRTTLTQAREATADLADNMEAMKRNFLLRGFFTKRGYFDLNSISPAEYRKGVLENGKRKAMRIWLGSTVLFETKPDGSETLTADGRARLDSAVSTYIRYLPTNPLVVEGYATAGAVGERYQRSRMRAGLVREYLLNQYQLTPQNTGSIALAEDAPGSPADGKWDGVALTLFLDREQLQFATQPVAATR